MTLRDDVREFKRSRVAHYLEQAGGNVTKAAKLAGVDRPYFHRLMAQSGGLRSSLPYGKRRRGMVWREDQTWR